MAPDSTAVLLGADTLFTLARLPRRAPDGSALATGRIGRAELAPDSASIAIELVGPTPAVVVWSRPKQTAAVVAAFPGGAVTRVAWSPDGRLLAFEGRDARGFARSGTVDAATVISGRHPVLQWLARRERSVRFQDWIDPRHARFLVSPGAAPEGGLAYVWDIERGAFVLEAHTAALAANAPPGASQPGGVFSLDLAGDAGPETVALYQARSGAPAALVLADANGAGVRSTVSEPLVAPQSIGLESWEDVERGPGLYQIAEIGDRTVLLLTLPSPAPIATIGLFHVDASGTLAPLPVATAAGIVPAIFPDGAVGGESRELGIADLDGDGAAEVIAARGRRDPVFSRTQWEAEVYRWDGGRLVAAPALERAALERLEQLGGSE